MIIQSKNTINQSKFRGIMSTSKFPTPTTENLFQLEGIHYGLSHKKDFRAPDDPKLDPLHIHETLEIFLNVDSNVSFLVNNRLYPVKKGDALISRANEMHVGIFNEARIHEHFCLWIDADESSPIFDFLRSKDYSSHISFDESTSKQLTELFFELEDHIKRGNKGVGKASCFLKIMTIFNESQAVSTKTEAVPPELQKILDDINENFTRYKTVKDIIENRYISAPTLNRWFREYVRLSPKKYLESKKLSYAASLLASGASVTDACLASGFSDCSHFIALFKKQFGKTPLKYRERKE